MNKLYLETVRNLAAGKIIPVYILMGEEEWARNKFLVLIKKTVIEPGMEDFNYEHFYASDVSGLAVADKAGVLPMMADRRLVIVEGCDSWKKKDIDHVTNYLTNINDKSVLVLQFNEGDRRRKLFSSKSAQVCYLEFPKPKKWELVDYIHNLAKDMKLKLHPDACALVAELAGDDLARVYRELDKLSIYKMDAEITANDVEALMGRTRLATRWELGDFIGERDLHGALVKMHHIMASGVDAPGMLGAVNHYIRQIYVVKALILRGVRDPRQVSQAVGVPPKITEGLINHQKNFSNLELRKAFSLMRDTDIRIKSSGLNRKLLLDQLLSQIITPGPHSPPPPRRR